MRGINTSAKKRMSCKSRVSDCSDSSVTTARLMGLVSGGFSGLGTTQVFFDTTMRMTQMMNETHRDED